MPELPESKYRPDLSSSRPCEGNVPYVELCCWSNFSFLRGASYPEELVEQAARLGYRGLALTDLNSLAGVVKAHVAAKACGLKLLVGAEITPEDAPAVVLLAQTRQGYGNLCRLITRGRRRAPKGECVLTRADLAEHAAGLIACVVLSRQTEETDLLRLREFFADRLYGLVSRQLGPEDAPLLAHATRLARRTEVPLVASCRACYHVPQRQAVHDLLQAIRHHVPVQQLGRRRLANAWRHLHPWEQLRRWWHEHPQLLQRTLEVADRCRFSLDELRYCYPREHVPPGSTATEYLARLTWEGARQRYPRGIPGRVRELLQRELALIAELGYEDYFLTVWDLVRFARSRGILCQGRGSAANSAVCYCLGITSVDPTRIDLLFERFVSRQRHEPPDIDVDFEHQRREEVIQYVFRKYGRDRAAMAATVITYRLRLALREVGKALGFSAPCIQQLARLAHHAPVQELPALFARQGLDPQRGLSGQYLRLVQQLVGFPRHLSQHTGGMVITAGPLCQLVPIENAAMPGRSVVQWDKDDLETLGILKVDCLGLGMLTALRRCFELLKRHYDRSLSLATVPAEDPRVYRMIQQADTVGVFQIESRAQMSMLPRLRPRTFYDLVVQVAIVRPGPIQGQMVHPYLRRRQGLEPVQYPDQRIRSVLEKTLGVPIFQEQAMRLAVVAAGFCAEEAEALRRAMGAWRKRGLIEQFRHKFIQGMLRNGYSLEFARRLFRQIQGFGEYGFPESHAASFALLVYVSAWFKCHYPEVFTTALLNSQPLGFYAPAQLVADARRHGVQVLPVDVNSSHWESTLEECPNETAKHAPLGAPASRPLAIRLGFHLVRGLSPTQLQPLLVAREQGRFTSWTDFCLRCRLPRPLLLRLAAADAFSSLGLSRTAALWLALAYQEPLPLFPHFPQHLPPRLPNQDALAQVVADYASLGLSLREHPVRFLRPVLAKQGMIQAQQLPQLAHGTSVHVAGLVLLRQRPGSARGVTFLTLEDETGQVNLIVRPRVWNRYRTAAATATLLGAKGTLQNQQGVIHLLVQRLEDLTPLLHQLPHRSRDFH